MFSLTKPVVRALVEFSKAPNPQSPWPILFQPNVGGKRSRIAATDGFTMVLHYGLRFSGEDFAIPFTSLRALYQAIPNKGRMDLSVKNGKKLQFAVFDGTIGPILFEGTCPRDTSPRINPKDVDKYAKALPVTGKEPVGFQAKFLRRLEVVASALHARNRPTEWHFGQELDPATFIFRETNDGPETWRVIIMPMRLS